MPRSQTRWRPVLAAALVILGGLCIAPLLAPDAEPVALAGPSSTGRIPGTTLIFARVEGMDGESKDGAHEGWIDVHSIVWGAHVQRQKSGKIRKRAATVVHDVMLTMEYDKAAPKLQEACLKGQPIAAVDIDMTASFGTGPVGFLKHELRNLLVASIQVNASGNDEAGPPTVVIGFDFEEIKVTYTEYDDRGAQVGNVEFEFEVK